MATNTWTQVEAISQIKMATACLFLGGAALAASAAGGLAGKSASPRPPDLVITSIQFTNADKIGNPEFDSVRFIYKNQGGSAVNTAFQIRGLSGKSEKVQNIATNLPANASTFVDVLFPKINQDQYPAAGLKVSGYIDYDAVNKAGKIVEMNENNNMLTVAVPKAQLSLGVPKTEVMNSPISYCNADASTDPQICQKRFASVPELAQNKILKDHQCMAVYKGLPIIKVASTGKYTTLDWNSKDKFTSGYDLTPCTKSDKEAASPEIVKACIDELYQKVKTLPFFIDQNECPLAASFCGNNTAGFENPCQKRLQSAGYGEQQAKDISSSYKCADVWKGIPVIEKDGQFFAMNLGKGANFLSSSSLSGCSKTGSNAGASTLIQARECIDEMYTTFSKQTLYLPQCAQFGNTFCKTVASVDPLICEKRLKSITGLVPSQYTNLLSQYSCGSVHKGFPVLKTGETAFVPVTWNTVDNIVGNMSLNGCTLVAQDNLAPTLDIAQKCIDQLKNTGIVKNSPFYLPFYENCELE